jgi:putative FmdB family regulatory protein
MPTYAYRCPACGHQFEKFHKMNQTAPETCPKCETVAERVITGGAGFVFKGSGFYATDYKKSLGEKPGKTEEKEGKPKKKKKGKVDAGDKAADKPSDSKKSGGES